MTSNEPSVLKYKTLKATSRCADRYDDTKYNNDVGLARRIVLFKIASHGIDQLLVQNIGKFGWER